MKSTHSAKVILVFVIAFGLSACSLPENLTLSTCENYLPLDSEQHPDFSVTPNSSHATGVYKSMILPRRRKEDVPVPPGTLPDLVTIDYMVHQTLFRKPQALVVLIAGGKLNAAIEPGPGDSVSSHGNNFLVRSAQLFASNSRVALKVITIDRPSDYADDLAGSTSNAAYDGYRTSMKHAVDLSAVINAENTDNLPVMISGTSRGAVSTVANYMLASAVSVSSPVTSGPNGKPVREDSIYPEVRPSRVTVPAHVLAHTEDACQFTKPLDAYELLTNLSNAFGDGVTGGFIDPDEATNCNASGYHGFMGIESCSVGKITGWFYDIFPSIPATRPQANPITVQVEPDTIMNIDLAGAVVPAIPAPLTFSLPYATTALGGTISLVGNTVNYTPPPGVTLKIDAFVYVVEEAGGGSSHNVAALRIQG